jgi:hypothetical protein
MWRAHHSVAPVGRGATAGQNKPDKPRAKKSGQLDLLTTRPLVRPQSQTAPVKKLQYLPVPVGSPSVVQA